ncbi:MAG: glycosyltransferase family 61 protein [Magnetospiraceae bacterium]
MTSTTGVDLNRAYQRTLRRQGLLPRWLLRADKARRWGKLVRGMARRGVRLRSVDEAGLFHRQLPTTAQTAPNTGETLHPWGDPFTEQGENIGEVFSISDAADRHFLQEYQATLGQGITWRPGFLELENVYLHGDWCQPIALDTQTGYFGSAIGWRHRTVLKFLPESWDGPVLDALLKGQTPHQPVETLESGILIQCPGMNVYGHWLLDFLPKIRMALDAPDWRQMPLLFRTLPPWGLRLLQDLGLADRLRLLNPKTPYRLNRVVIPTTPKLDKVYCQRDMRATFSLIAERAQAALTPEEKAALPRFEKIFLPRPQPKRKARNHADIAKYCAENGFHALAPEQYSLFEQAVIFSRARHVVGEDGSALHNAGFCAPGARLGLYSRGQRQNIIHLSLASAFGLHLTVVPTVTARDDSYHLPPQFFAKLLS